MRTVQTYTPTAEADAKSLWLPGSDGIQLDEVRVFRPYPAYLQGDLERVNLSAYHQLAAESLAYYVTIDRAAAAAEQVGVHENVMAQTAEMFSAATHEIVNRIYSLVDKQIAGLKISEADRLLLVSDAMNRAAHLGETRLNGLRYDTHPRVLSQIAQLAAEKTGAFDDDPEELLLTRYNLKLHDAQEHAQSPNLGVSPLHTFRLYVSSYMATAVLMDSGFSVARAVEAGEDLASITHLIGVDGRQRLYADYVRPVLAKPRTASVKTIDFYHNGVLDPKSEPIDPVESEKYQNWVSKLSIYALGTDIAERNAESWILTSSGHATLILRGIKAVRSTPQQFTGLNGDPLPEIQIPNEFWR